VLVLALWPVGIMFAVGAVIRRGRRGEPVVSRRDVAWLWRKAVLASGALLTLWIVASMLVAFASIFVRIPDI
jgi:hypothetical protein